MGILPEQVCSQALKAPHPGHVEFQAGGLKAPELSPEYPFHCHQRGGRKGFDRWCNLFALL